MEEITISVRLEPEMHENLKKLSDINHRSMSGMVTFLIDREIKDMWQSLDLGDK